MPRRASPPCPTALRVPQQAQGDGRRSRQPSPQASLAQRSQAASSPRTTPREVRSDQETFAGALPLGPRSIEPSRRRAAQHVFAARHAMYARLQCFGRVIEWASGMSRTRPRPRLQQVRFKLLLDPVGDGSRMPSSASRTVRHGRSPASGARAHDLCAVTGASGRSFNATRCRSQYSPRHPLVI